MAKGASIRLRTGRPSGVAQVARRNRRARAPASTRLLLFLDAESSLDLVSRVEAGLPYLYLEVFQAVSMLDAREVSDLVRIPPRTLARRRSEGRLHLDESDRLVRASRVFEHAVDLFEGYTGAALRWLRTPQPGLGNRKPLELASTDVGAREVEDLIGRLEHGVFS